MESPALIFICISAFTGVFVLLTLLAVVMRIITVLFPDREIKADTATVAAVISAVSAIYPGTQITKIKELK